MFIAVLLLGGLSFASVARDTNRAREVFYGAFQEYLESEGIENKISKCVTDELRQSKVADTLDNLAINNVLKPLASQIRKAAAKCLPPDHSNDQPKQLFQQFQSAAKSTDDPPRTYPSHYLSKQGILFLCLGVSAVILAKLLFIAYAIYSRKVAGRSAPDDDPLLR